MVGGTDNGAVSPDIHTRALVEDGRQAGVILVEERRRQRVIGAHARELYV